MRELGFSEKWPKLKQDTFTTFRFRRRDRDWVKPKRVVYLLDGKPQVAEVGGHPWGYKGDIAKDTGGQERLEVIEVLEWEKDDRRSR